MKENAGCFRRQHSCMCKSANARHSMRKQNSKPRNAILHWFFKNHHTMHNSKCYRKTVDDVVDISAILQARIQVETRLNPESAYVFLFSSIDFINCFCKAYSASCVNPYVNVEQLISCPGSPTRYIVG